jgi:hypothetical protein
VRGLTRSMTRRDGRARSGWSVQNCRLLTQRRQIRGCDKPLTTYSGDRVQQVVAFWWKGDVGDPPLSVELLIAS